MFRPAFSNLLLTALTLAAPILFSTPVSGAGTPPDNPPVQAKKAIEPLEALRKKSIERGRKMSLNNCLDCHTFDEDGPARFGPNLFGIVGKKHAAEKGFAYSKALSAMKNKVWTEKALDEWIYNPNDYAPGTSMARGQIMDDDQRADIIEYLKTLK